MAADGDDAGAAVARQRLALMLQNLRKQARNKDGTPITIEQAAQHMERARPTAHRIINGLPGVRVKDHDVKSLAELFGADNETTATMLALAAATRVKGWFSRFRDVLPPGFDMYIGLEAAARAVWAYEGERVHGLLQTEEYAREILRISASDGPKAADAEFERRVAVRMRRQEILTRTDRPVDFTVVLGEAVLHRTIGGPAVMARQLQQINERGALPNVSVKVVPYSVGAHYGIDTGPFAVITFPEQGGPATAYMDNFTGHLLTHKPSDIGRFEAAAAAIDRCALNETASRNLISQRSKELSSAQ
ncbi:DUF5753 domain-containing protein [Solwaraspora sp. WMMB335]|uniref:DUF5753 domain-containing protein n=1 Tax=Solwaraspora sp. WMMB335 TaxID=3404118 RepID=UPI003B95C07E